MRLSILLLFAIVLIILGFNGECKSVENEQEVRLKRDVQNNGVGNQKKPTRRNKKKGTRSGKKKGTRSGKKKGTRPGKKKGTRAGKQKGTRKAGTGNGTPCPRQLKAVDDECLAAAIKYQAALSGFVTNLQRQYNRIKSQNKTGSGKAEKKGDFAPLISKLIKAGGGNASNMSCAGSTTSAGATALKNNTDEITACQDNIFKACDPTNFPKPNVTYIEKCLAMGEAFDTSFKACKAKKGDDACTCWKNETLATDFTELKKCNFSDDANKIKTAFKSCKSAFGACRKLEDKAITSITSCSESPDALKKEAAQLQANNNAVTAAQEKIKALTSGSSGRRKRQAASCGSVIVSAKKLTIMIKQSPTSPKIKIVAVEISSSTVSVCSEDEVASLKAEAESLESAASELTAALTAAMSNLEAATGSTPSSTELENVELETTTAASANTTAASNATSTNATATNTTATNTTATNTTATNTTATNTTATNTTATNTTATNTTATNTTATNTTATNTTATNTTATNTTNNATAANSTCAPMNLTGFNYSQVGVPGNLSATPSANATNITLFCMANTSMAMNYTCNGTAWNPEPADLNCTIACPLPQSEPSGVNITGAVPTYPFGWATNNTAPNVVVNYKCTADATKTTNATCQANGTWTYNTTFSCN